jgi:hypothetical protein
MDATGQPAGVTANLAKMLASAAKGETPDTAAQTGGRRKRKHKSQKGGGLMDAITGGIGGAWSGLTGKGASAPPPAATPPPAAPPAQTGGMQRGLQRGLQRGKSLQRGLQRGKSKSRGRSMRRGRSMQASRAGGRKTHRRRKHRSRKQSGGIPLI